jgi:hypothetical protein
MLGWPNPTTTVSRRFPWVRRYAATAASEVYIGTLAAAVTVATPVERQATVSTPAVQRRSWGGRCAAATETRTSPGTRPMR